MAIVATAASIVAPPKRTHGLYPINATIANSNSLVLVKPSRVSFGWRRMASSLKFRLMVIQAVSAGLPSRFLSFKDKIIVIFQFKY